MVPEAGRTVVDPEGSRALCAPSSGRVGRLVAESPVDRQRPSEQPSAAEGNPTAPGAQSCAETACIAREAGVVHPSAQGRSRRTVARASIEPLSEASYYVKLTASEAMIGRLRRAQELLSHAIPDGDIVEILDRGLMMVIAAAARERHAGTDRPRKPVTPRGSDLAHDPSARPARRHRPRRRPVRVRRARWPTLRGAEVSPVPPSEAMGGRRTVIGGEHRAPVPRPQQIRGEGVLRPDPGAMAARGGGPYERRPWRQVRAAEEIGSRAGGGLPIQPRGAVD